MQNRGTSRGRPILSLGLGGRQGRLYPAAGTGTLWGLPFHKVLRKKGWPFRWSPQTVSQGFGFSGPSPLVDNTPGWKRLENRPFLHFPVPVGMTAWALGPAGGWVSRRPLRMVTWSAVSPPHRRRSAKAIPSRGCGGSAWSWPMRGQVLTQKTGLSPAPLGAVLPSECP